MAANSEHEDGLGEYRAKRDAERTPEPFGHMATERRTAGPGIFVVQLHAARRRHYDFRIELDGVLQSWAVPRGPSLDPADKRMAIHVESHPIEYATFEGLIPEGNYGAGAVVVWDTGVWIPVEDPVRGLENGKLLFDLRGYKLRGRWTLVRTHKARQTRPSREWLLIKKPDAFADPGGRRPPGDESVFSGLTLDELGSSGRREQAVVERIAALGAPARELDIKKLDPMLCQIAPEPFSHPDWIYELKYDGYRLLAAKIGPGQKNPRRSRSPAPDGDGDGGAGPAAAAAPGSDPAAPAGQVYLRYRSGVPASHIFPDLARAVAALPYRSFILDGEVVVFGDDGRPVFSRLQGRTQLQRPADIRRAAALEPVTLVVFDLLGFAGHDLRALPVIERKALLRDILPRVGPLRYADHVTERGRDFYAAVVARGLEGVIAKRADSPYQGKRSDAWLKLRSDREGDFAIVGYTSPQGNRVGFGALHVAAWTGRAWHYAGRVGSGFGDAELAALSRALRELPPWEPSFAPPSTPQRDDHWVEPKLVCTVKYLDWTRDAQLRFPRFLHLRGDKRPRDCEAPAHVVARVHPASRAGASPTASEPPGDRRAVQLSNLDKVFWPATADHRAYTKGDLVAYYRAIAPWILPYLRDRPVVLTRYPDGIAGKSFFQKDAPAWVPDWIRTETLWSKHARREIHYFVCDRDDSLTYLANMATIPLHIWSSRIETLSQPDWAVLDLDPKGAPFEHVVAVARATHALCNDLELRSFVKTSGQDGLHILIPLAGACTYSQSRQLAQLLAKVVEAELPDIATTRRSLDQRGGKVYIDYVQNGHGRLIAAPYSVRPRPGAPVSMPLEWSEVTSRLDTTRFSIKTALGRVRRLTGDPMAEVLEVGSDLALALELLARRVGTTERNQP